MTDVECPDRHVAGGTTGRVRLPGGVWLPFEVTACERDRWTWKVARVPATGHRVEPTDRGSRVGLDLPLYGVAYAPVCRRALREVDRLAGERDDGHRGRHPPED